MHRMRWPSLFICCGGDQLSPAGKYLSSCHSETSPNWSWESAFLSGRRTGPVIRVGAAAGLLLSQFPVSAGVKLQLLHTTKEVQKPSVSAGVLW